MADETQTISISHFKATCLAVLETVRQTGLPVRVTRRGEPVAEIVAVPPGSSDATWIGSLSGTIRVQGDIVSPVADADEWEALD